MNLVMNLVKLSIGGSDMYITFLENKTRFNLIKEDEFGLLYNRMYSDTLDPVRGTGHTRLEFCINSTKRAKRDGGGSKRVDIYLSNVYSSVVINNSVTELLICTYRKRLYDFRPVPKDVLSRAILAKLPLSDIWNSYKVKNFYKPIFEYEDEFLDLKPIDYKPSERTKYELISIDFFIDKDGNWSVSPSPVTKYRISEFAGKKYKRLVSYTGNDMELLEPIDFSTDTYYSQYYNIILDYFDLIKA